MPGKICEIQAELVENFYSKLTPDGDDNIFFSPKARNKRKSRSESGWIELSSFNLSIVEVPVDFDELVELNPNWRLNFHHRDGNFPFVVFEVGIEEESAKVAGL